MNIKEKRDKAHDDLAYLLYIEWERKCSSRKEIYRLTRYFFNEQVIIYLWLIKDAINNSLHWIKSKQEVINKNVSAEILLKLSTLNNSDETAAKVITSITSELIQKTL